MRRLPRGAFFNTLLPTCRPRLSAAGDRRRGGQRSLTRPEVVVSSGTFGSTVLGDATALWSIIAQNVADIKKWLVSDCEFLKFQGFPYYYSKASLTFIIENLEAHISFKLPRLLNISKNCSEIRE